MQSWRGILPLRTILGGLILLYLACDIYLVNGPLNRWIEERKRGTKEALARAVAPEIAPKRINVVSPGTIDTPMVALQGEERKALYAKMVDGNIIPRAGTADEVAQAIVFMVQNDFVTGTTIDVDGGWILS